MEYSIQTNPGRFGYHYAWIIVKGKIRHTIGAPTEKEAARRAMVVCSALGYK